MSDQRSPGSDFDPGPGPRPYALPGSTWRRTCALMWRGMRDSPRASILAVIASVIFGVGTVGSGLVLGRITDDVLTPALTGAEVATSAVWLAGGALFVVAVITAAAVAGRRVWAGQVAYEVQAAHRLRVTRQYLDLPMTWHRRHSAGRLLSNANSDAEAASGVFMPLPFAIGVVVMLVIAAVAMLGADPLLGTIGVSVLPLTVLANAVYRRLMGPRVALVQRLRAGVSDVAHESFEGAVLVKALGAEEVEERRFARVTEALRDASISMGRVRSVFDPVIELLPAATILAVVGVGIVQIDRGAVDPGAVVMIAYLLSLLTFPVRAIGFVLAEIPRSLVGYDRIAYVVDAEGHMPSGSGALAGDGPLAWQFEKAAFDAPSRRLDGGGLTRLVSDLDVAVPPGRTVAVVGATGAGKSTLAALLARIVDPSEGVVSYDGRDARELSGASRTAAVALVGQSTFVFDDTVRGNIALERPGIGDAEIWQALEIAQAAAFVRTLPAGLDTRVGERGASLSGGQRQRLAIARALVGRPRLLVLDDATSAVDTLVERAILSGLHEHALSEASVSGRGRISVLLVAYRSSAIAMADTVIHMHGGRIVDTGSHAELMARDAGYADLVTAYATRAASRAGSAPRQEPPQEEQP